jgi:uracil-DNA glycosylase family 4
MPSRLMCLVDIPGAADHYSFSNLLTKAGLPNLKKWYVTSVVKCGRDTPTSEEITACGDNIRMELAVVDPEWVLLLGAHALAATGFTGNQISKCHGRPFIAPAGPFINRKLFPTFHPGVGFKDQHSANLLAGDLSVLYGLLAGSMEFSSIAARVGRSGKLDLNVEA